MKLTVNGSILEYDGPPDLAELLRSLGLAEARVVVELNGAIVGRNRRGATAITEGDVVEIVRLVGGG
ncbi:MAG TPA: sulfur carrier protein ThiS [Candidatus Edwardsbacteria bacterium]|nr:sulfur carrier protein ThiS [Candidatus Edwardsbacteria bacterium]